MLSLRPLSLSLAALLGLAAVAPPAIAQSADDPIQLEASLDGKAYLDRDLQVTVVITNAGKTPLSLPADPGWDREGGLTLEIAQVNGTSRTAELVEDPMRNTVRAEGKASMTLPAGHSIAVSRSVPAEDVLQGAGQYRLVVTYTGDNNLRVASEPVYFSVRM